MTEMFLVLYDGNRVQKKVAAADGLVIGRRGDCGLPIPNETVSGRHCRIVEAAGGFHVEDLGSQNKTLVEGGPTLAEGERHPLQAGMTLVLGHVRVGIESGEADTTPPTGIVEEPTLVQPPTGRAPQEDSAAIPAWRLERPRPKEAPVEDAGAMPTQVQGGAAPAPPPPAAPAQPPPAPAAQRPAPAPPQAPPPASTPPSAEDSANFATINFGEAEDAGGGFAQVADAGVLRGLRPRLVVDNDAARGIYPIEKTEFLVARTDADLAVRHKGVSRPHARIFLDGNQKRLRVQDLGSKNYTYLGGEVLAPDMARELGPESHLRFGPIDALFVMDKDYDGEPMSQELFSAACDMLTRDKRITSVQRQRAESEARAQGRHVGEVLIADGAITVKQWVRALDHAEIALIAASLPGDELRKLRTMVYGLAAVVVLLLVLVFVV